MKTNYDASLYGSSRQFTTAASHVPGYKTDKVKYGPYDQNCLHSVYDEQADPDGRLFKITVVYKNDKTGEKTYITGAKGAN